MERIPQIPSLKTIELEEKIFNLERSIKADEKLSEQFGVKQKYGDHRLSELAELKAELERTRRQ
jgi:hypothetical protein